MQNRCGVSKCVRGETRVCVKEQVQVVREDNENRHKMCVLYEHKTETRQR